MFKKLILILLLSFSLISSSFAATLLPYPKFQAVDSTGVPYSGGKVYTYIPGSTTAKASYSNAACTSANANPVVLDGNGEAVIFLKGKYKILFKTSADVEVWTMDNVQGMGDWEASYADFNEADQGVTGEGASIKALVDTIATKQGTIILSHSSTGNTTTYTVTTALTIPTNITLKVENGARITKGGAGTLTINGPFESGLYQVFSGFSSGDVTFGAGKKLYPQWWGAKGDGTTDDRLAIQSTLKAAEDSIKSTVNFGSFTYYINSWTDALNNLVIGNDTNEISLSLIGNGATITTPLHTDEGNLLGIIKKHRYLHIKGINFVNTHEYTTDHTHGIRIHGYTGTWGLPILNHHTKIEDCTFTDFTRGIYLFGTNGTTIKNNKFFISNGADSVGLTGGLGIYSYSDNSDLEITGNYYDGCVSGDVSANTTKYAADGFFIGGANGLILTNNTVKNFGYEGIYVLPELEGTNATDIAINSVAKTITKTAGGFTAQLKGSAFINIGYVAGADANDGMYTIVSYTDTVITVSETPNHDQAVGTDIYVTNTPQTRRILIANNILDATRPTGSTGANWGIRCDQSHSNISNNIISNAIQGIATGLYSTHQGYKNLPNKGVIIANNIITMEMQTDYGSYGIGVGSYNVNSDITITGNMITWERYVDSTTNVTRGIYAGGNRMTIIGNTIKAFYRSGTNNLIGISINNTGDYDRVAGNVLYNMTTGIGYTGGSSHYHTFSENDFYLCDYTSDGWAVPSRNIGSLTWDPGSLADGVGETSGDIAVTGAKFGDFVIVAAPYDLQGITVNGYVQGDDVVRIRIQNETTGTIDLGSGKWYVKLIKDIAPITP